MKSAINYIVNKIKREFRVIPHVEDRIFGLEIYWSSYALILRSNDISFVDYDHDILDEYDFNTLDELKDIVDEIMDDIGPQSKQ